jgi:phenylacetate-CoA ligase
VPYYRNLWFRRRRHGDCASWEYLENWPILEKEPLRENSSAFVADDCEVRRMFHEHTSGTTGKSLDLWWSRQTVRAWYALFEARWRRWYGVSRHDRWAILGGQLITPAKQRRPPFWIWNAALNQLYMSSYHLAADLMPYYLDALQRYQIKYLWGYSSSLYALAQEARRLDRNDLKMVVTITNAEPVFEYQRQAIAAAFQCPVRETYGMAEIVAAASECPAGRLHLWPEVGIVEALSGEQTVAAGSSGITMQSSIENECHPNPREESLLASKLRQNSRYARNDQAPELLYSGDLVCTGLLNADMPLIRYRVGDRGVLPAVDTPCSCGRALPAMASVEGRADDVLYTADGRQIGRLDPVFKAHLPVREAQIIQEALDRVRVRYVPAPDFTPEAGQSIIQRLQQRMGRIEVILEPVDQVPRTKNGKLRAVICNLPASAKISL